MGETRVSNGFPTLAGVLFGLGLGGFFDGNLAGRQIAVLAQHDVD